jgi:hypothetical protein
LYLSDANNATKLKNSLNRQTKNLSSLIQQTNFKRVNHFLCGSNSFFHSYPYQPYPYKQSMSNNQEEMRKLADAIELLQQSIQNTDSVSANPAIDSEHIRNLADALSMIGNLAPSSSVATDATDASDNTDSAQSADRMRSLADAIASLEQIEKKLDVVAAVPAVLPAPIVSVSVPIVQPAEVAPAPTVPVQEEPVAEI